MFKMASVNFHTSSRTQPTICIRREAFSPFAVPAGHWTERVFCWNLKMAFSADEAALMKRIMTFISVMFPEKRNHRPHWRQQGYRDDFFALFLESTRFDKFAGDMIAEHIHEQFKGRLNEDDVSQLYGMFQAWDEWRYCKAKLELQ